jgi:phosphatidylglycerol:prolipoprotein diacylglycerol transferase
MQSLSYIIWNLNPKIFPNGFFGIDVPVVWYGLLFAMGFFIGQQIMIYIYKQEGKPEKDVETLTVYMIIATVIGARLGHVLFYEPDRYLSDPIEIIKIWNGGLASHGAAFGILLSLWIYSRYDIKFTGLKLSAKRVMRPGQNFLQVVDRIVIVVALAGALIRFGNFTNSEIEGIPTNNEYGVVFMRNVTEYIRQSSEAISDIDYNKGDHLVPENYVPVEMELSFNQEYQLKKDQIERFVSGRISSMLSEQRYFVSGHIYQPAGQPLEYSVHDDLQGVTIYLNGISRHPAQLYESFTTFLVFILLFFIWKRRKQYTPPGLLLGLFLIILFGLRFVHEYFKENQVAFEDQMTLNMGQILSIPLVIAGIFILLYALRHKRIDASADGD